MTSSSSLPTPAPTSACADPDRVSDKIVHVASLAAEAARAVTTRYFRSPALRVDFKSDDSPVTAADREAEAAMRAVIQHHFPSHTFLGEEGGTDAGAAEWTWVADPVDGTKSFLSGKATFGTLIAVLRNGAPVYGVIDQAITDERWCGGVGRPTTLNGFAARVREGYTEVSTLEEAERLLGACICFATHPGMFIGADESAFRTLEKAVKHVMYGCDCYAYALLASGHTDLVVEADLKVWDFAALAPVVIAAGGIMTDWNGEPLRLESDGRVVAAANAVVHEIALVKLGSRPKVPSLFGEPDYGSERDEESLPGDPGPGHVESMTGFGEGEAASAEGDYSVTVQLRSVNSRYFDLQYRGPRFLAPFESEFAAGMKRSVKRGKIMFTVGMQNDVSDDGSDGDNGARIPASGNGRGMLSMTVDDDAVRVARAMLDQVADSAGIESKPTVADLLTFSEILVKREAGLDAQLAVPVVREAIQGAVEQLLVARRREGAILQRDMLNRCSEIERIANEIEDRAPERLERELARLQERLLSLTSVLDSDSFIPGRLEQEIAILADRVDITEELVRLRAHCQLFKLSFLGASEPIGQKLVFMLQEMHRESTTIGAKATDAAIAQLAVLMKQEVEKIREQVMNIS